MNTLNDLKRASGSTASSRIGTADGVGSVSSYKSDSNSLTGNPNASNGSIFRVNAGAAPTSDTYATLTCRTDAVSGSTSRLNRSDINTEAFVAEFKWNGVMSNWAAQRRVPKESEPRMPLKMIREWGYELEASCTRQRKQIQLLKTRSSSENMPSYPSEQFLAGLMHVSVLTQKLEDFMNEHTGGMTEFISIAKQIPESGGDIEKFGLDLEIQYFWTIDVSTLIDEQIQEYSDMLYDSPEKVAESPQAYTTTFVGSGSPPPSPGVAFRSLDVDPKLRGPSETSNTRARDWNKRRKVSLPPPLNSREDQRGRGGATTAMSSVASYKATLATLGGLSFLGASLAWSAVFTGARGDLVILSWASAAFVFAAVAAAGMGIVVEADAIDFDRDMGARRAVRLFMMASGLSALAGIILMGVATAGVDPMYGADPDGDGVGESAKARKIGMQASGWFIVASSISQVVIALGVRIWYNNARYRW